MEFGLQIISDFCVFLSSYKTKLVRTHAMNAREKCR